MDTKIGLEIHGYLDTKEKLFCSCKAVHGAKHSKPNTNICPICTGQPGAKPMLPNKIAIDKAVQISLILNCKINDKLIWKRKHYGWPDLPKGYQNTLSGPYAIPVGERGKFLGIGITEAHLEEDPAAWNPKTGGIDYNRSGSPLIEIVTEPDFKNSEEVIIWLRQLITTLGYIRAIDKKAGIKADVNVSILGGARIEIKNINSLRNIKTAIDYEIKRQEKNKPREQETRMFNESKGATFLMRTKEQAEDYRFISEPNLPIINIDNKRVNKLKKELPEPPHIRLKKLVNKYKIDKRYAEILTKKLEVVDFFEEVIKKTEPKLAVRWVTEELLSVLNYNKKELEDTGIKAEHFIELLEMIRKGKITELKAKDILRSWTEKSFSPKKEMGKHAQISDKEEIKKIAKEIIRDNKKAVEDYKTGNKNAINFLIGQIMKKSNKRADYNTSRTALEDELK